MLVTSTVAVLATAMVLATALGCSRFGGSDETGSSGEPPVVERRGDTAAPDDATPAAEGADSGAGSDPGGGVVVESASVSGATAADRRSQIRTATMDIEVEVLEESVKEATTAVAGLGGFSANEDIDLGERRQATITYRVPADRIDDALDALAAVGDLQTQQVDAEDVTAQYADLEGRVTTLRTSITRLQGFLAEATDANQVALLEGELTRREAELESTEAQRRALADSIELSTITVSFTGSDVTAPVDDTRTLPTFLGGLETGWDILLGAGAVALSTLGFLAPFLPLVLLAVVLARWARRRRHPVAA